MQPTVADATKLQALEPVAKGPGQRYDALLLDAGMRQMLAATRSLGRRGLRVRLAECFAEYDPSLPVPAFRSRFAAATGALPDFQLDPDGLGAALERLLIAEPTRVLICGSDGAITALRPWRERLQKLTHVALACDAALDVALDKERTGEVAARLGIAVPHSTVVDDLAGARKALRCMDIPLVIKPVVPVVRGSVEGRLRPELAPDRVKALAAVEWFLLHGTSVMIQPYVSGPRETVCLMLVDGRVHAEFAQAAHRMTPVLGGASTMRESIDMPADLRSSALALMREIGLDGYAEGEFRRDADGKPWLMEINARLSGSIEIAQRAGVDFAGLLWQWAAGESVDTQLAYRPGVRLRWLRGDYAWLRENLRQPGHPDGLAPRAALRTFASDFFRPVHYDYLDIDDLGPLGAEAAAAWSTAARRLRTRSRFARSTRRKDG